MSANYLPPIKLTRKTGSEQFIADGQSTGVDLLSFWRWAFSDELNNAQRGVLAEYIVASALGCNHGVRTQWVRISEHRDRPFRLIVTAHFANA